MLLNLTILLFLSQIFGLVLLLVLGDDLSDYLRNINKFQDLEPTKCYSREKYGYKLMFLNESFHDDIIHSLAVKNQINNYKKPIKSIETRENQDLDGLWEFCLDKKAKGLVEGWYSGRLMNLCTSNLYHMPVPSAYNEIPSIEDVKDYIGWVWYQKEFYLNTRAIKDRSVLLHFDNVNYMALVWLTKQSKSDESKMMPLCSSYFLGGHVGGYLPFQLNITEHISLDLNTRYFVTVAVNNRLSQETIPSGSMIDLTDVVGYEYERFVPNFDFFHYSGIMGSVKLFYLPEIYLSEVELDQVNSSIKVCIENQYLTSNEDNRRRVKSLCINEDCFEPDLSDSGCHLSQLQILPQHNNRITTSKEREDIQLVHQAKITRVKIINDEMGIFDIYEMEISPMAATLNSLLRHSTLQGFGMHHEQSFSGRTMSLPAIMKDVYLLKQMGANIIRTSHYPYSEAFLTACDRLNIFVVAECQAVGLRSFSSSKLALHKQLLREMMDRDHHHPSIIMWSVANEPQSQMKESQAYFEELLRFARKDLAKYTVKASRPLTAAIAQSHKDDKIGHTLDLLMINRYYGWYENPGLINAIEKPLIDSLTGWSSKFNNTKGIIVSEFGADAVAGLHGFGSFGAEVFTEEYQAKLLLKYEQIFDKIRRDKKKQINFLGSMIWNFADFDTHQNLMRVGGNKKGIFTKDRKPKLAAEAIRQVYWKRIDNYTDSALRRWRSSQLSFGI